MQATVKWVDNAMFLGESGSGHSVVMDGPPDHGGRNLGIRPMEMLLIGMGGCASFDVMSILRKTRQQVSDCRVELTAERADIVPAVFTVIHLNFIVTGKALKEKQVAKAVSLSATKYCSASIMMNAAGVKITHDYQVVESE
ncbi:MAG: putative redox protein [Cellvibrionaceae bacterium]|jgi:putative redox protein